MGSRLLLLTTCAACAALASASGCDTAPAPAAGARGPAPAAAGQARAALVRAQGADSGKLRTPRRDHAAVLLGDGRVLLVGGETEDGRPLADVELYEPLSGRWTEAAPLQVARSRATATLLDTGEVLVSGGLGALEDGSVGPLGSQELFDPRTGTWRFTGALTEPRADHSATRLLDGRVLLAGGQATAARVGSSSAEVYQPQLGLSAGLKAPMSAQRFAHSALRLQDGRVLLAGGDVDDIVYGTARTELFDPALGSFSPQASLPDLRFNHSATLLPSGRVALVGGRASGPRAGSSAGSTFLWDGPGASWAAGPGVAHARESHTAALLPSGRLLVAGGWSVTSPRSGTRYADVPTWEQVTADGTRWEEHALLRARARHSSTLLPTGEVLLAGGESLVGGVPALVVPTELLEVADDGWTPGAGVPRAWATSTLLPDGRVLVLGPAKGSGGELVSGEGTAQEQVTPLPLAPAREEGSATLLEGGQVLLAGGRGKDGSGLREAALFFPGKDVFVDLPPLLQGRARHSATLLPNGNVLVAGGAAAEGQPTEGCELFDPMQGTWRALPPLAEPRAGHSATLLPDGRVLLAGGVGSDGAALHSVELFDPREERWESVPLAGLLGRERHAALLAADGSVLLVGGLEAGSARLEVERLSGDLLSPGGSGASLGVEVLDSLPEARVAPTLTLLLNGRVLVAGGADAAGAPLATALLLDGRTGRLLGPAAAPAFARGAGSSATLLPDGRVRLAGGGAPAELYDEGRGAPATSRPVLASLPPASAPKRPLVVKGSGLTGVTEASGGTARAPATDVPLLLLRRADGSLQGFASTSGFSATALSAELPLLQGGRYWVYPVTNAVVGEAQPLQLGLPRGEVCSAGDECASGACASGVCCDRECPEDACGTGTCLAQLAPTGGGWDGGITSVPGTYAPTVPREGTPGSGEVDGGTRTASPPRFSASYSAASAQCARPFVSTPSVQGDGPFEFALAGEVPEGLQLDPASGTLSWRPTRAQVGHYQVQRVVRTAAGEDTELLELDVACEGMKLAVGCGCNSGGEAGSLAAALGLLGLLRRRRPSRSASPARGPARGFERDAARQRTAGA